MFAIEPNRIEAELIELVKKYGSTRSSLKPILHELQTKYQGIPDHAMQYLADLLGIHVIEIQDVVSFYKFYSAQKQGKYVIRMCRTMPCKMQAAAKVAEALQKELGIAFGQTTQDGMYSLEWTNCLGMCDLGPALLINNHPYTKVKPEEIKVLLQKCKEEGK